MGVTGIRRLFVVVVLGASVGLNMFTSAIVNLALPTLAADLNADIATVQWVILAYFVTIASLHLPMGRLGDRFGRRRIFLIGATIFALGALLSGFASGLWPLVAMRVVQGFGGGIMQAIGPPLLVSSFTDSERGRATGIIGLMIAVGLLAGPAAGGLLIGAALSHVAPTPRFSAECLSFGVMSAMVSVIASLPAAMRFALEESAVPAPASTTAAVA